jgi:acetyl esterase/lipase
MLLSPMLDDRNNTVSSVQMSGTGFWDRTANQTGWQALLGDRQGGDTVSVYAAPARAKDLSAMPATFIDVGSAETFRDESVTFASTLWRSGVQAELHVWAGGFHGYEAFAPTAAITKATLQARQDWLQRQVFT